MIEATPPADALAAAERHLDSLRRNHTIDMTRGKPAPEQLDLSDELLANMSPGACVGEGGDYRNYGLGTGIPEAKRLMGAYLEMPSEHTIVAGNSSLTLMHDTLVGAVLAGVPGGAGPWGRDGAGVKFICPAPGYDRHFAICAKLGIEMLPVDMHADGPDMDAVEKLAGDDPSVKGMWCVPKYSNPTGAVYADAVVERLANMSCAAPDFRIMWDDAYAVHHLSDERPIVKHIFKACTAAGNGDRPYLFASTSKITYAGAGLAALAASPDNIADIARKMSFATIGPDKITQLRHVKFLGGMDGLAAHMEKHAALIRPKFAAAHGVLQARLGGTGMATWTAPKGGYFISADLEDGNAAAVVRLTGEAGVALVPAGSTFPYGRDPRDRNVRIAPTMPSVEEVTQAMEVFCACVQVVSLRRRVAAQC